MSNLFGDIDTNTKEFLHEILNKTSEWKVKAETMQKVSLMHGVKGYLLGHILDTIGELQDICNI